MGTFATRTVVHSAAAIPIADGLPPEQACLIGCSSRTGVGSVLSTAAVWRTRGGDRLRRRGSVGRQGARSQARPRSTRSTSKRANRCAEASAQHIATGAKLGRLQRQAAGDRRQGLEMLGHAGTLVYIGLPQPGAAAAIDLQQLFDRRLRVVVSHGGDHVPALDFPQLVQWAQEGKIDLAGMVTKRIGLEDVARAFDDLKAGAVIRSVILF
jgi:alcohol dehydrogenase